MASISSTGYSDTLCTTEFDNGKKVFGSSSIQTVSKNMSFGAFDDRTKSLYFVEESLKFENSGAVSRWTFDDNDKKWSMKEEFSSHVRYSIQANNLVTISLWKSILGSGPLSHCSGQEE